jgi:hypothetical protein
VAHILRQVAQVLGVALGQHHAPDARAPRACSWREAPPSRPAS